MSDDVQPDGVQPDGESGEPVIDPDVRFGSAVTSQATVRMALIAIGLVFFVGIAIGYFLGKGA